MLSNLRFLKFYSQTRFKIKLKLKTGIKKMKFFVICPKVYWKFVKFYRWIRSFFCKRRMELAVVGLQDCGKTTFTQLISTGQFLNRQLPTIGFNMQVWNKGRVSIKVWDLGGQPRFRSAWTRYCRGSDAILFMVDASERFKLQETRQELNQLLASPVLDGMPLLVLGNKADLRGAFDHDELFNEL
ncbi:unnamed protein product [Meloidogyne enterolobii]|uniref:Uncharacterized protein n=1 Tax=Meloidogyne enterolobii TaxID=390850 RepID=A0ACB1B7U3_MELEN